MIAFMNRNLRAIHCSGGIDILADTRRYGVQTPVSACDDSNIQKEGLHHMGDGTTIVAIVRVRPIVVVVIIIVVIGGHTHEALARNATIIKAP